MIYLVTLRGEDGDEADLVRQEVSAEAAREWGESLDEREVVRVEECGATTREAIQLALEAVGGIGRTDNPHLDWVYERVRDLLEDTY